VTWWQWEGAGAKEPLNQKLGVARVPAGNGATSGNPRTRATTLFHPRKILVSILDASKSEE